MPDISISTTAETQKKQILEAESPHLVDWERFGMVRPERFERPTYWFVASCSIQLSYGRTYAGNEIVTAATL